MRGFLLYVEMFYGVNATGYLLLTLQESYQYVLGDVHLQSRC